MNNGKEKKDKLTTAAGRPYVENENTMSVGPRGPLLLQDYILHEKMAHFNRERIPERVVHAKGSGAFGTFTVTHDIDRKSTRLNSSHANISYAVFCLKKKKT